MELIYFIIMYVGTLIGVPSFLFALLLIKRVRKNHPVLLIIVAEQVITPIFAYWFATIWKINVLAFSIDNILWLIFLFFNNKSFKKYVNVFLVLILVQELIHVIWFPKATGILIYFQLSLVAIFVSAVRIYNLGIEARDKIITRNPVFLMNSGVIFYFALSLVSNLFFDILLNAPIAYFLTITTIQILAALTLHTFIFLSIWRMIWK